jgi:signal peptidase I
MNRFLRAILIICFITGISIHTSLFSTAAEEILSEETVFIRGNSLMPLLKAEDEVKIWRGYYQSHPVKKGDLVLVDYTGRKNALIKLVKGIAGDRLDLQKADDGKRWYILINGKILKNSEGRNYILTGKRYKKLSLHEGDIPKDSYLVLGNVPTGSLDATRFGLVERSQIIAKVEKPESF